MFFLPWARNVYDAHGRAHWHLPDQEPEPAGDRGSGIPSGVYRHHFRTGSPGSGGPRCRIREETVDENENDDAYGSIVIVVENALPL